jgi:DNA-binding NarL/FixJ family response regulator
MSRISRTGPNVISVLVADSNKTQSQLLTGALRRHSTFKVAQCPAKLSECLAAMQSETADVVLLADGLADDRTRLYAILRGLHSAYPKAAMVLLLDQYDRGLIVDTLRAGARGLFCLALMPFKSLCRCITSVYQGQYWTNAEQMRFVIDAISTAPALRVMKPSSQAVLTSREEQTVTLVAEGLTNREIGNELKVKENTVKKSLLRIYDKVGVSNRVELVLYALSHRQELSARLEPEKQSVEFLGQTKRSGIVLICEHSSPTANEYGEKLKRAI